jgi:hypothetical protein
MHFNDVSNKDGIIQMLEQTTGLGDAGISSGGTATMAYFTNLINTWYRIVAYYIWKVDRNWSFDDVDYTTLPSATADLVNGQRDYTLPTTAMKVKQVEIMDISGNYYSLSFMREDDSRLFNQKEQETAGIPTDYRLVGDSVILYPKPDTTMVTATNGIRVTLAREVYEFVVADTTREPGMDKQFHPILYYGPALEWATIKGVPGVQALCTRMLGNFAGMTEMLTDFHGDRNKQVRVFLSPQPKTYK